MSAPAYSQKNFLAMAINTQQAQDSANAQFNAAKAEYEKIRNKYLGENGWNLATKQAEESAGKNSLMAGKNAAASTVAANRTSGISKSKSAASAAAASTNAARDSYTNLYSSGLNGALTNNNNTVNAANNELTAVQQQGANNVNAANNLMNAANSYDQNRYTSQSNNYNAQMGLWGGAIAAAGAAISDETQKDIHSCSNGENRCDEILEKLRGL